MRAKILSMLVAILLLNVVGCSKVTDGKAQGRHAAKMLMDSEEAVIFLKIRHFPME